MTRPNSPFTGAFQALHPFSLTFWLLASLLGFYLVLPRVPYDLFFSFPKLFLLVFAVSASIITIILSDRSHILGRLKDKRVQSLFIISLLYLLWITYTNIFSTTNINYSILGFPRWNAGYVFNVLCILILNLIVMTVKTIDYKAISRIVFGFSLLTSVLCVLEYLGFNPYATAPWFQKLNGLDGTTIPERGYPFLGVGNSGYLSGVWLLLTAFYPLIRLHLPRYLISWLVLLALGAAACHGKIAIILLVPFFVMHLLKERTAKAALTSAVCLAVSFLGTSAIEFGNTQLYRAGLVARSNQADFDVSGSLNERVDLWKMTLMSVQKRPLIGYGYETLSENIFEHSTHEQQTPVVEAFFKLTPQEDFVTFNNFIHVIPKEGKRTSLRAGFIDIVKPHNFLLEELYSNGIIGLALFVSLVLSIFRILLRKVGLSQYVAGSFLLYGVYLCGWFTTLAVTPICMIILALGILYVLNKNESFVTEPPVYSPHA